MNAMQSHPAADAFPMMVDADFAQLKADIAARGMLQPIWLCDGMVLDGRNRLRACEELGIEPRFETYSGPSPVEFAWSLNGLRRHLSPSQRAAIAVKLLGPLKEEAKKRMVAGISHPSTDSYEGSSKGRAIDEASKIVGVGATTIQLAKTVHDADPETFKRVERGEISANKAHKIVTGRVKAPDPAARNQPREQRAADIRRLANDGMRIDQIASAIGIGEQQVTNIAKAEGIVIAATAATKNARRISAVRVVGETVNSMEGLALGLSAALDYEQITKEQAVEWLDSLIQSMKHMNNLKAKLREIANGN